MRLRGARFLSRVRETVKATWKSELMLVRVDWTWFCKTSVVLGSSNSLRLESEAATLASY